MEKRYIGLITALTIGYYAYQATERAFQIGLGTLAGFSAVAGKGCDVLVEAFYKEEFLETYNWRNLSFCGASITVALITAATRNGLNPGATESRHARRAAPERLFGRSTGSLDGSSNPIDGRERHDVWSHYLTALSEIQREDIDTLHKRMDSFDTVVHPLHVINTTVEGSEPSFVVAAAKQVHGEDSAMFVMSALNSQHDVDMMHSSEYNKAHFNNFSKRDVEWGQITYISYRVNWENRKVLLGDIKDLPDTERWFTENCPKLLNDQLTEEMDANLYDAKAKQSMFEHPVIGGRIGLMHDPSALSWKKPELGDVNFSEIRYMNKPEDGKC